MLRLQAGDTDPTVTFGFTFSEVFQIMPKILVREGCGAPAAPRSGGSPSRPLEGAKRLNGDDLQVVPRPTVQIGADVGQKGPFQMERGPSCKAYRFFYETIDPIRNGRKHR